MESLEVLVWVFFVGAVVIFNLVQQWQRQARRRLEEMQAQTQAPPRPQSQPQTQTQGPAAAARTAAPAALPAQPEAEPPRRTAFGAEPWGRAPDGVALEEEWLESQARPIPAEVLPQPPLPVALPARTTPPPTPRVVPGARAPRQRPFRTAREVRQGIVAMTVLGPCRALDPYEPSQAETPRS